MRFHATVVPLCAHVCGWVKGSVGYRLKERKVSGGKSVPGIKHKQSWKRVCFTNPDRKWRNQHDICIAACQIWLLDCLCEFHNSGGDKPGPQTAWMTRRNKVKSGNKSMSTKLNRGLVVLLLPLSLHVGMCVVYTLASMISSKLYMRLILEFSVKSQKNNSKYRPTTPEKKQLFNWKQLYLREVYSLCMVSNNTLRDESIYN